MNMWPPNSRVCYGTVGYTTEYGHPKHQNWFLSIQVRRAQLQNLLANEQEQYAEELNNIGKTFHTQRL